MESRCQFFYANKNGMQNTLPSISLMMPESLTIKPSKAAFYVQNLKMAKQIYYLYREKDIR
jgi:hypothetical protein